MRKTERLLSGSNIANTSKMKKKLRALFEMRECELWWSVHMAWLCVRKLDGSMEKERWNVLILNPTDGCWGLREKTNHRTRKYDGLVAHILLLNIVLHGILIFDQQVRRMLVLVNSVI